VLLDGRSRLLACFHLDEPRICEDQLIDPGLGSKQAQRGSAVAQAEAGDSLQMWAFPPKGARGGGYIGPAAAKAWIPAIAVADAPAVEAKAWITRCGEGASKPLEHSVGADPGLGAARDD
jgi:hypothetical protein